VGLALLSDLLCSIIEMSSYRRQHLDEPDEMLNSILLGSQDSDIVQIQQFCLSFFCFRFVFFFPFISHISPPPFSFFFTTCFFSFFPRLSSSSSSSSSSFYFFILSLSIFFNIELIKI